MLRDPSFLVFARFIDSRPLILVDGQRVEGTVSCAVGGSLPSCAADRVRVDLAALPAPGDHTFQLATRNGLHSNELLVVVE